MLKVLIIDDEPNVRLGLKKIIPWDENGFEVCGEGQDAEEGYDKIINLNPDIVLIDIKLPGKLGTDVIREAREAGFKGKFIIISGYSNFEYAKTAIKYGVKSYVLKPIDEDELMDLLLELKIEIENERVWIKDEKLLKYTKLQRIILEGDIESNERGHLKEEYNKYEVFQIALIYDGRVNSDKFILEEQIRKQLNNHEDIDIIKMEAEILMLFKDFNSNRIYGLIRDLKHKLGEEINSSIFIVLGEQVNSINKLKNSYTSAKKLLEKRFLFMEKGFISTEYLEQIIKEPPLNFDTIISKIYSYVEISDVEKIRLEFRNLEKLVIQRNYLEEQIKALSIKIFFDLKQKLVNDYKLDEAELISNEEVIEKIYGQISLRKTIDYLIENFIYFSAQIGVVSSENTIKRIIGYINKNYYMDLKLETLAEIFNYNSAYLGKLFKNSIGENFNTYLDKIRIEKAKVLLVEDKLKVYQVCEKVGYKNIDYFHSKFKKYVGKSPLSYKKQFNINDERASINE